MEIQDTSSEIMAGNREEKTSGRTADWKQSDVYRSDCMK